jgi:hypothetical protein
MCGEALRTGYSMPLSACMLHLHQPNPQTTLSVSTATKLTNPSNPSRFGLAGVISTILPFALAPLLEALGAGWTLLLYAGVTVHCSEPFGTHKKLSLTGSQFVIGGPTVYLLRVPAKAQEPASRVLNSIDWSVFRRICFTAMTLSNVLQGLVYSIPAVFLPGDHGGHFYTPCEHELTLDSQSMPRLSVSRRFKALSSLLLQTLPLQSANLAPGT